MSDKTIDKMNEYLINIDGKVDLTVTGKYIEKCEETNSGGSFDSLKIKAGDVDIKYLLSNELVEEIELLVLENYFY